MLVNNIRGEGGGGDIEKMKYKIILVSPLQSHTIEFNLREE